MGVLARLHSYSDGGAVLIFAAHIPAFGIRARAPPQVRKLRANGANTEAVNAAFFLAARGGHDAVVRAPSWPKEWRASWIPIRT